MRTVAAVPAIGLLAGSSFGLIAGGLTPRIGFTLLVAGTALSCWAWRSSRSAAFVSLVGMAFTAGGVALAADAWREASRPPLRVVFERLARQQRQELVGAERSPPEDDEAFAVVEGVLRADAVPSSLGGVSLSLYVERIAAPEGIPGGTVAAVGGVLVTVSGAMGLGRIESWRAGRRVRMPLQLHRPARYLDPGVADNERALARTGTTVVGVVKSGALVEVVSRGSGWQEGTAAVRLFARSAIERAVGPWSRTSAAIVRAIVIGDRAAMDDEARERLQAAGTYHVIAISGGNIAILTGLMIGVFRVAGCLGRRAMAAAIALLIAYASLVEGGASVERATLMAVVYLAARILDHRAPPLNGLWFAAALLVAAGPLIVADPGFILTFGATLGILLAQASSGQTVERQGTDRSTPVARLLFATRQAVRRLTIASIAAEAVLFPVAAVVFSRVTFAGLVLNLAAIPLMAVAQLAGMALVPLAVVSADAAAAAGWLAHLGAAGLVWSADLVRLVPAVTYRVAPPSWGLVVTYYAAAAAGWCLRRHRQRLWGSAEPSWSAGLRRGVAALAVGSALCILVPPLALRAEADDGRLHLTFLDVGQGDAALIRLPGGTTMLVDAGGLPAASGSAGFDIGDRVVAPVLRAAGLDRLDYAVVTHGDPDHIGGMGAVVAEFRPREIWDGVPVPRFEPLGTLRRQSAAVGGKWTGVVQGVRVGAGGADIVVHHPPPADWERQKVRNDDSIVLEIRWRDVSVLFTGDIGAAVEQSLADTIPPAPLRIMKVPHHGSLTSSSRRFVQAMRPAIAVVSAGRANHFGHPAPAVLERYREVGAELFRTDRDGAIVMDSDGYSIDVQAFTGRRVRVP